MVDFKDATKLISNKSINDKNTKTWKYIVMGVIGVVVVLILLLVGFFLNTIISIAIILVSLFVVGVVGVLIYRANRKLLNKN
jgi:Flp pilus assembly protein TadB